MQTKSLKDEWFLNGLDPSDDNGWLIPYRQAMTLYLDWNGSDSATKQEIIRNLKEAKALPNCTPTVDFWLYFFGLGGDLKKIMWPIVGLAMSGNADAQTAMGFAPPEVIGVVSSEEALTPSHFFHQAAEQNYPLAQKKLGLLYENSKNYIKALDYYKAIEPYSETAAKEAIARVKNFSHIQKTKIAGEWLFNPVGLFGLLSIVAAGALANPFDPLIFAGVGLTFCAISVIGLVLQAAGSFVLRDSSKPFSFSGSIRSLNQNHYLTVNALGLLAMIGLVVAIVAFGALTPLIDAITSSLWTGFNQIITVETAKILATTLFVITPVIATSALWRFVVTLFISDEPATPLPVATNRSVIPDRGPDFDVVESGSEPEPKPELVLAENYVYTREQMEYLKAEGHARHYLVRALYDFVPERADQYQLTFNKGDLIWVVDSHPEEDWWIGEMAKTGEKGYFPVNYVETLQRPKIKPVLKTDRQTQSFQANLGK